MFNRDVETTLLRDAVAAINPALSAVFRPAEDETVDDEIAVTMGGEDTGFSLQIGYGYVAAGLWNEADGELWELGDFREFRPARARLVRHVATAFRVRS